MKNYIAALSIVIEKNGHLSVKHDCDVAALPTLLGGLEMSKQRLKEEINGVYRRPDGSGITKVTETVSKEEAFKRYVAMGEKIKKRLLSINESDDRATFEVLDDTLLHKL